MGDHRASIKIEFEMHGIKDKMDFWINWTALPGECDRRISEWCADVASRGLAKFEEEQWEAEREARETATKRGELEELDRLKAKYE